MTTIQKDEYVFEVEVQDTIEYYQALDLCECGFCENFYAQIKGKFPKLEAFLSEFGVDVSKPDEIHSVELDNEIQYISVDYTVCGKIVTIGQHEINIHDNLFLNIVITDGFASPNMQTSDYFTISVCNIVLPWVSDKPFPSPRKKLPKTKQPVAKDPKQCLNNIKKKITKKIGISSFIDLGETSAAFSGTIDNYDLYISLNTVKKRGKDYLYAYMEDHFEWYEWNYKSQNEFEEKIVEYFCENINRTIKTVTETKKYKYVRVKEYYLDKKSNEWILMSDNTVSKLIFRPFITEDSVTEEIKEYHL